VIINDTVTNLLACVGLTVIVVIFLLFITTLMHFFSMCWDIWRYKKSKNKDKSNIIQTEKGGADNG
jgi:uncharacterized protein HemY